MAAFGAPVKAETGVTNTELLRNPSKVLFLTVNTSLWYYIQCTPLMETSLGSPQILT